MLSETYPEVRKSIVALVPKWRLAKKGERPKTYTPIVGTGFIVSADGLVVTNEHVVRALMGLPKPPNAESQGFPGMALLYHLVEGGQVEIPLPIVDAAGIAEYDPGPASYVGQPDVALLRVDARELPALQIDEEFDVTEGVELATAGFPMGRDALTAPGWLQQITPTLQRGVVSASLPFPGSPVEAFSINVMVQGGASGSPVFVPDTGSVVGLLYAGLRDWERTESGGRFPVPTNISYAVPAHAIRSFITGVETDGGLHKTDAPPTIDEIIKRATGVDRYDEMGIGSLVRTRRSPE